MKKTIKVLSLCFICTLLLCSCKNKKTDTLDINDIPSTQSTQSTTISKEQNPSNGLKEETNASVLKEDGSVPTQSAQIYKDEAMNKIDQMVEENNANSISETTTNVNTNGEKVVLPNETKKEELKNDSGNYIFTAKVGMVHDKDVLVLVDTKEKTAIDTDVAIVYCKNAKDFAENDMVEIEYDGTIRETAPPQIDAISIKKIKE